MVERYHADALRMAAEITECAGEGVRVEALNRMNPHLKVGAH